MNFDEARIEQYFHARSSAVDVGAGDPAAIAARAAARRRRRRSAGTGVLALALVAGAIGVQQRGDGANQVTADAIAMGAADPLEWTTVVPKSGLGWSSSPVVGSGGTMFGLSTAPGRHDPNDSSGSRTMLYRSTDGVEWGAVALPDDLYPSRLAMNGDQLYAVGTAPAGGGGRSLVLAAGGADGSEWNQVDLPLDLAALEARYDDVVSVNALSVAAGPNGVVASVNVSVWADPTAYVPPGTDVSGDWRWTADGLELYEPVDGCELSKDGAPMPCTTAAPTTIRSSPREQRVAASYTWAQLGIDEELRSLIQGELHVFTSVDGTSFDEVALPVGAAGSSTLVATDDGFVLFAQTWPNERSAGEVHILHSSDGRSWTADPSATFTGYLDSAGRVDGRAAAVVIHYGENGLIATVAHTRRADGGWSTLDLTGVIELPQGKRAVGTTSAIGPMGIAAAVIVHDPTDSEGETTQQFLVYSPDGVDVTSLDVTDRVGGGYLATLRVSADAVFAGFSSPKHDPNAEPSMTLLVGTTG